MIRTLFLFFCACLIALSRVSTSEITGTISDSPGAVVPGAQVTARNEATGTTYRQTTTNSGLFAFAAMPAGSYTITAGMAGFIGNVVSEKAIKDLPLNGRNPLSLLALEPGVVQRSSATIIQTGESARVIQLGLKLDF